MIDRATSDRRLAIFGVGILCTLALAVFAEAFSGNVLAVRDLVRLTIPYRALAAELWGAGVLPAWNSAASCGTPLLADPVAGVLDPATFAFLLPLPPFVVGTALIATRYLLAALLMARFLRRRGHGIEAAFVGAIAYAFSGFSIGSWTMIQWVAALPLLPLALGAAHAPGRPAGRGLATAAVFALYLFSGAPEALVLSIPIWLLELDVARRRRGEGAGGAVKEAVIGLAGAFAFGLVQILPTMELLEASDRWGGRGVSRALAYSFTPFLGLGHVLPLHFLGEGGGPSPRGLFPFPQPLFFSTYVGATILPLVMLGALGGGAPHALGRRRWFAVAAAGWIAAYGVSLPGVIELAARASWLTVFGFPAKLFVVVPPALAILAARGVSVLEGAALASGSGNDLEARALPHRVRIAFGAAIALVVVVVVAGLTVPPPEPGSVAVDSTPASGATASGAAASGALSALAAESLAFVALFDRIVGAAQGAIAALLVVAVIVVGVLPRHPALARVLLVVVVAVDLGVAARPVLVWNGLEMTGRPPAREIVPEAWPRVLVTGAGDFRPGAGGARHLHALADVASGIPWRLRYVEMYSSFQDRSWNLWWQEVLASPDQGLRMLGAVGARWFLCDRELADGAVAAGYRVAGAAPIPGGAAVALAHPAPLPEVRFYVGAVPGRDRLLESGESVAIAGRHRLDGTMEAAVEIAADGWLYRAETWFPGWGAFVDGSWIASRPADGMPGQLLPIRAGLRDVNWTYRSPRIAVGLAGSAAAALAGVVAMWAAAGMRAGRGASSSPGDNGSIR